MPTTQLARTFGVALAVMLAAVAGTGVALAQQAEPAQPPQQSQEQQPPAPPPPTGRRGLTVASDSLLGSKVLDAQGQEIGQISKLLIDPKDGKISSVIISHGGTLGFGRKEVAIPWDNLKLQHDERQRLVVTLQQPLLDQAPSASPPTGNNQRQPR